MVIPFMPDMLGHQEGREPLTVEHLGMDSDDRHLFTVGTVKDADATALRQRFHTPPEVVMV
jgi:hypothetical protein